MESPAGQERHPPRNQFGLWNLAEKEKIMKKEIEQDDWEKEKDKNWNKLSKEQKDFMKRLLLKEAWAWYKDGWEGHIKEQKIIKEIRKKEKGA